jgi:hypothetical protein
LYVRLVERFRSADAVDLSRRRRFHHIQHVIDRDDANQGARCVRDGQRAAVVLAEHGYRGFLVIAGLQCDKPTVHQVRDAVVKRSEQELANTNVVDQESFRVDDVYDIQRFAVLAVGPDVVEYVSHGPVFADGDIMRRHQPAHRPLGIAEEREGDLALFGCKQR